MLSVQRANEWVSMLVKSSIAAVLVIAAVAGLSRIDYRELYDEMYPVNGLRRDVLNLCHDAKPTFVRALEADRISCYDGMPEPVAAAIEWVRTSARLAAMRRPTPVEQAEKLLVEATLRGREDLLEPRRFTGYVVQPPAVQPCRPTALALAAERSAPATARPEDQALAAIGVLPRGKGGERRLTAELPVLPLGDDAQTGSIGTTDAASGLLDAAVAAALGDSASSPATGCHNT
jgi:hypothetical protein